MHMAENCKGNERETGKKRADAKNDNPKKKAVISSSLTDRRREGKEERATRNDACSHRIMIHLPFCRALTIQAQISIREKRQ
jgi:hypothetical protein